MSDLLLHAGGPLVEVHKWVPGRNVKVSKHDGHQLAAATRLRPLHGGDGGCDGGAS